MGYFSNGTEGMDYYEAYCARCVHDNGDGPYCPVWQAHQDFNYKECNNKDSILHMLIPRSKDGLDNEQCLDVSREGRHWRSVRGRTGSRQMTRPHPDDIAAVLAASRPRLMGTALALQAITSKLELTRKEEMNVQPSRS